MTEHLDLQTTYKAILDAARQGHFISYGDLAKANGAEWQKVRYEMNRHLGELVAIAVKNGWPIPSAIVVNQQSLETGALDGSARDGFLAAARANGLAVDDPEAFVHEQQQALFAWAKSASAELGQALGAQKRKLNSLPGPKFVQYFAPVLDALRALGGAAEPKEVMAKVQELANVSEIELKETDKNGQSKYENKIGWAKFYLAKGGLIDSRKRGHWQLTADGRETFLDHDAAMALFKDVRTKFQSADEESDEAVAPEEDTTSELFNDPVRQFWFVGALWNGSDDQTERFVRDGIWQNGYDEKFGEHVQRMKRGDRIAIKASFVQKYGLPFDNQEKPVSCMRIKAVGTITEATNDGKTVKVDWNPLDPPKHWYFYTYRITVVEADASDELARRLIQFTFGDHKQDYDFWLRVPYFAKKYKQGVGVAVELDAEHDEAEVESEEAQFQSYEVADILADGCFLSEAELEDMLDRLRSKKNLILQGPPGTGKTWLAKRLAHALIGTKDRKVTRTRTRVIQFHPSLSYEDFVRGYRPDGKDGLALVDGAFLEAVEAARALGDRPFVAVIEEINRGNPAQIFGEMLTLLEEDKRREEEAIELAYRREAGERVYIPKNLYVIGTMNIADRSLALVDLALRRRFAFVSLRTALNERWKAWCTEEAGIDGEAIALIERVMTELNDEIEADRSLGAQFRIGHSYVTPGQGRKIADPKAWFRQVVETEIGPLLEEYWYDNLDRAQSVKRRLLEGF
jgi:5-methylcytosine-specific restriction protein B